MRHPFRRRRPRERRVPLAPLRWLLLDIDGTVSFAGRAPRGEDLLLASTVNGNVTIRPHVPALLFAAQEAGAHLAWYSAWGEDANPVISDLLGQRPLPAVPLAPGIDQPAHLKAAGLASWVAEHHPSSRYVIVDDDLPEDITHNLPANVHALRVDPEQGLLAEHVHEALTWLDLAPIV